MKGWGIRIQIGRTRIELHRWLPSRWETWTTLISPKLYGFGIWITRDRPAGSDGGR